eukprot:366426-Chlamydomonas_euryale.AAC.3
MGSAAAGEGGIQLPELALCMLVHFFVHPLEQPQGRNPRAVQRDLARFILLQLNVRGKAKSAQLHTCNPILATPS